MHVRTSVKYLPQLSLKTFEELLQIYSVNHLFDEMKAEEIWLVAFAMRFGAFTRRGVKFIWSY